MFYSTKVRLIIQNSKLINSKLSVDAFGKSLSATYAVVFIAIFAEKNSKGSKEEAKPAVRADLESGREEFYRCLGKILSTSFSALYPLTSLTKSSSRGLTRSLEETKEHRRGCKPPVMLHRQRKPRKGDRDRCKLLLNKLHILSPLDFVDLWFRAYYYSATLSRGFHPRLCSFAPLALI